MADDQARFLARAGGYTRSATRAIDALEAVSPEEQARQTEQARRDVLDERVKRRTATAEELRREQAWLEARLRFIGRELRRLGRPAR